MPHKDKSYWSFPTTIYYESEMKEKRERRKNKLAMIGQIKLKVNLAAYAAGSRNEPLAN